MSQWIKKASTFLDSVDTAAKGQLAEAEANLSATERRERRRKAELLGSQQPDATVASPPLSESSGLGEKIVPLSSLMPPPSLPTAPSGPEDVSPDGSAGTSVSGSFVVVGPEEGNEAGLSTGQTSASMESSLAPAENPVGASVPNPDKKAVPQGRSAKELALEFPDLEGLKEQQQIRLLKTEIQRLKGEIESLNIELEDMEIRMEGQKDELRAAGEAVAHATRKSVAREQELLDEITILENAKEADKKNYLAVLKQKDEEISKGRSEVLNAQAEAESSLLTVGELNERIRKLEEEKIAFRLEADQAHMAQNQDYGSLRSDLRAAEDRIEEMKDKHANWVRSSERRQASLEENNAELTQALAEAQRLLDTRTQSYQQLGMQTHATDAELHALQEELHGVQAALELERQHVHSLQREARTREIEASATRVSHEEERSTQARMIRDLKDRLEEQEREMARLESQMQQNNPDSVNVEFEKRLKTMTDQLLKKQVQLDETACERATLTAKLKATHQRALKAEQSLATLKAEMGGDMEAGLSDATPSTRGVRRRYTGSPTRATRSMAKIQPIAQNAKVAKAVDIVDKITMQTGVILRNYPEARLAFLFYLLMLHLWALFMLVYNAHNIEELHPDTGMQLQQG